jgi:hypothetical protein
MTASGGGSHARSTLLALLQRLIVAVTLAWLPTTAAAFETYQCTEYWYPAWVVKGDKPQATRIQPCQQQPLRKVGFYRVVAGKAYWYAATKERYSPCSGRGVGALGNLLDPVCYLPGLLQKHKNVEVRRFWLVSADGESFQPAATRHQRLQHWQQQVLDRYASDRQQVYWNGEPLPGADVATFEIIFPWGADPKWADFGVAQDRHTLFIDKLPLPRLALERVDWLDVRCETGDLGTCQQTAYASAHIGRLGGDLLYLRYGSLPTLLKGVATDDMSCSRREFIHYCTIRGVRYQIHDALDASMKLVPVVPAAS